jgi:hypothetical protein
MDIPKYSRYRSIPIRMGEGDKERIQEEDTAARAEKAHVAINLSGNFAGSAATDCRRGGNGLPRKRQRIAAPTGVWFAKGPVRLDEAARVARCGAAAVLVWLAVRARADGARGASADVKWMAGVTGFSPRTIRHAVAALIAAGVLMRKGEQIALAGQQ